MQVVITLDTDNTQDTIYLSNLLGTNTAPAFTHTLGDDKAAPQQEDTAEEAPKRKRRTKAEIEADKAAEEAAAKADDTDSDDDSGDFEEAKAAVLERASALVAQKKTVLVKDALKLIGGVARVSDLTEDNLQAFVEALDDAEANDSVV